MIDEYKNLADSLNLNKERVPRARRFFKNLDKIESLLKTGITIKSLVNDLKENGFDINLKTFEGELYRARKKIKQGIDIAASQKNDIYHEKLSVNDSVLSSDEKPKYERRQTIKQIQAESALEFKELEKNAKKQHSKAVQYQLDKLEKRKNEQENNGN